MNDPELISQILTSKFIPKLMTGTWTDEPLTSFVGQCLDFLEDWKDKSDQDLLIENVAEACFPDGYRGDSIDKLPDLIKRLRNKHERSGSKAKKKVKSLAQQAVAMVAGMELWRSSTNRAFISVPQEGGGALHMPIGKIKHMLRTRYYSKTGGVLSKSGLEDAIALLEARALTHGAVYETAVRVAHHKGVVFIDLCQSDSAKVVHIEKDGWRVTTECPVKFLRMGGCEELPEPTKGRQLCELRDFLGLSDEHWQLLLVFLLSCLGPGPFLCLLLDGEHGSGKSFLCEVIKLLIDPNKPYQLSLPKDEENLIIQASQNHLLLYDNVTGIKWDMSDALCRLATGAGESKRQLYTDADSYLFDGARPFGINGIGEYASRQDLLDRSVPISLPPLENKRTERELRAEFLVMRPELLGSLYDKVAFALLNLDATATPQIRMADAARWVAAAVPNYELIDTLSEAQSALMVGRVVEEPLFRYLLDLVEHRPFEALVSKLFDEIKDRWDRYDKGRPGSAGALSTQLARIRPAAEKAGLLIRPGKRSKRGQTIWIGKPGQENEQPRSGLPRRY